MENLRPEVSIDVSADAGGDHFNFYSSNVPIVHFFTGMHANYHETTDTAEKINYDGMRDITEVSVNLGWEISELPSRPDFVEDKAKAQGALEFPRFDHGVARFLVRKISR